MKSDSVREGLRQEPDVQATLERAKSLDVVLTGIGGDASLPSSVEAFSAYATEEDRTAAATSLGSLYGYVLDEAGRVVDTPLNRKLMAVASRPATAKPGQDSIRQTLGWSNRTYGFETHPQIPICRTPAQYTLSDTPTCSGNYLRGSSRATARRPQQTRQAPYFSASRCSSSSVNSPMVCLPGAATGASGSASISSSASVSLALRSA